MIEHGDMVEVWNKRVAFSSGEPSLDGSAMTSDDEQTAFSDSDIQKGTVNTDNIAKQVKGPSSDALEVECKAEAHARHLASKKAEGDTGKKEKDEEPKEEIDSKPVEEGWEDILGSGHLQRKIEVEGKEDKKPRKGQYVTVKIEDTLLKVDSHDELTFILGFGMVIDAWEMVVLLMKEGEKCKVRASARFAYGSVGHSEPKISPDQDTEYTIELLSIGDSPTFSNMPFEEFSAFIDSLKARGKYFFQREEYDKAVYVYKRSMDLMEFEGEGVETEVKKLYSMIRSNVAMCYSKIGDYRTSKSEAEAALDLDPNNVKAMLKRAQALEQMNEIEDAVEMTKEASEVEPGSPYIARELIRLRGLLKEQRAKERELYKRMLAGLDDPNAGRSRAMSFQMRYLVMSFFVVMFAMFFHFLVKMYRED
ncbi:hypothetical protein L596_009131 [Steinernema carpocapsae]|uniref:peptidylprolyl isomerase n=1 Tax=Steinernema carpocapsae TaxID=34508 RepID=A0A4U5PEG9_STECR|nr:hypothetical protein L596_009131 [Steinernema carpocapsae]